MLDPVGRKLQYDDQPEITLDMFKAQCSRHGIKIDWLDNSLRLLAETIHLLPDQKVYHLDNIKSMLRTPNADDLIAAITKLKESKQLDQMSFEAIIKTTRPLVLAEAIIKTGINIADHPDLLSRLCFSGEPMALASRVASIIAGLQQFKADTPDRQKDLGKASDDTLVVLDLMLNGGIAVKDGATITDSLWQAMLTVDLNELAEHLKDKMWVTKLWIVKEGHALKDPYKVVAAAQIEKPPTPLSKQIVEAHADPTAGVPSGSDTLSLSFIKESDEEKAPVLGASELLAGASIFRKSSAQGGVSLLEEKNGDLGRREVL